MGVHEDGDDIGGQAQQAKPVDQEQKVETEEATKRAAELDELEAAIDSGEYKEPIDMLKWLKSHADTPLGLKLAIEKQLGWYKLSDESDTEFSAPDEESEEEGDERLAREDASTGDESDNMDDAARERIARGERA